MAMRYRCKNKTCSKTLNGYDSQILRQLPLRLQAEFPAYFTHKSAVSKKVGDLLRICMQNATGPQRFAKILREIHKMRHHRLELRYLDAVRQEVESPTMLGGFKDVKPKVFSKFEDMSKYAGYVPSASYLRFVYTSMIEEMRPLMDKQMMMLEGRILKGDHSFKIVKHIAKLGDQSAFSAMYTVCNEFEEIRMQILTPTHSLSHLQSSFEGPKRSYEM
ncbi:MAG: hypothetical protein WCD70_03240 [Alphaproteobacteria bacterium]